MRKIDRDEPHYSMNTYDRDMKQMGIRSFCLGVLMAGCIYGIILLWTN